MNNPTRILVVDDSRWVRTFVRSVLGTAGMEVLDVDPVSAYDVMLAIRELQPDLVLLDYEMPHCNGETLVRFLREDRHFKDTPILMFTAHAEKDLVERLSEWNLSGYLVKPMRPEELVAEVTRCLSQS